MRVPCKYVPYRIISQISRFSPVFYESGIYPAKHRAISDFPELPHLPGQNSIAARITGAIVSRAAEGHQSSQEGTEKHGATHE